MILDQFNRSIFNDKDLFNILYNYDPDIVKKLLLENTAEIQKFQSFLNDKLQIVSDTDKSISEHDSENQQSWLIPDDYQNIDIINFLLNKCPKQNYQRLIDELEEFKARNMLDLLRWLKYFVDICRQHKIVWGVGRGSSVASYTLYLLDIHKIDSVKYNLDYKEFLR